MTSKVVADEAMPAHIFR